ncbi:MAG: hypothetical protein KDC57_18800 [Saprospiraceae bacterium]|nr:hypothetical protein [Saprospiraceae bacterium]
MKSMAMMLTMLFAVILSFNAQAQPGPWEKLGSRKVTFKQDYDEIVVTGREGTFRALKLMVEDGPIEVDHIVVHYRRGKPEELNVRQHLPAGGETRVLDLRGGDRIIRRVVFYYQSTNTEGRRAKVTLYGKH